MNYEDALKQAYQMVDCLRTNELYDDIRQEIAIELWLNPDENINDVVSRCRKKVFGEEKKHNVCRAESFYNEDGECVDDNIYFVDQSTVEHNEQKSLVTDEQRHKVAEMNKTLQVIDCIYARYDINTNKQFVRVRNRNGRCEPKKGLERCLKELMKNYIRNWNGLAIRVLHENNWPKKLREQKQWLCWPLK